MEEPLLSDDLEEVPSQISHSSRRHPSEEYRHEDEVRFSSLPTSVFPKKKEEQLIGLRTPGTPNQSFRVFCNLLIHF